MKKLLFLFTTILTITFVKAQMVEHYENPTRFHFSSFDDHNNAALILLSAGRLSTFTNNTYHTDAFFSRKYTRDVSHQLVYGVALPFAVMDKTSSYEILWQSLLNFYDTSDCLVIIGNTSQDEGIYEVLATAHIHIGESALIGNYFKMPDSDSSLFLPFNSTLFPVIEVYFDQPQVVAENYLVGFHLQPLEIDISVGNSIPLASLFCIETNQITDEPTYAYFISNSYLNTVNTFNRLPVFTQTLWGGPFPIVTPPPCMPPLTPTITEQHKQGATIEWDAQYGNTVFEIEYGPQGFAEGTGTTVSPIYPNSQHHCSQTLSGLPMNTDLTVRVRAFCEITGGYSDWQSIDFHSELWYTVATSVNNDNWGFVQGGGDHLANSTIQLFAYPKSALCPFVNWSDGNNQNPRTVTVTRDTSFKAIFRCDSVGIYGFPDIDNTIVIYPNPASGDVTIQGANPIGEWTITDILGRNAKSGTSTESTIFIDLKDLRPGIYIVTTHSPTGTQTRKLTVK